MRRLRFSALAVLAAGILFTGVGLADEQTPKKDSTEACMQMQGSGVTEDGRKAMREFMQSDRAPQAMANMMEMARQMGGGDPMLGMTRMMEMMGGQGGGMGGMMGGMKSPDASQPGK